MATTLQVEELNPSQGIRGSFIANNNAGPTPRSKRQRHDQIRLHHQRWQWSELKASNSFELEAVNDVPVVSGPVDLGSIDEDGSIMSRSNCLKIL